MKSEQMNLNYLGFLSTPPSSGRTKQCMINCGGSTTRRSSSPKDTFNGIYEGDFSMLEGAMKDLTFKSANCSFNQQIAVDRLMGDTFDLGLDKQPDEHMDDEVDEIVDEEIRGKIVATDEEKDTETEKFLPKFRPKAAKPKSRNYWEEYKRFIFTPEQSTKIETAFDKVKENGACRKIFFAIKCVTVVTIWILRLFFTTVVMRAAELGCTALRSRNILRSGTRRILWYMTLAKCGDLQLYGIILLLSPLLFLIAFFGFICTSYCEIKNVIFLFIGYIRHRLDVEPPKFD